MRDVISPNRILVSLYIVGRSKSSQTQIDAVKGLFKANNYPVEAITVVDLLENPREAASNNILAIPTLIRRSPTPMLKIIGSMEDDAKRIWNLLCDK